jgi:hypothetical protein
MQAVRATTLFASRSWRTRAARCRGWPPLAWHAGIFRHRQPVHVAHRIPGAFGRPAQREQQLDASHSGCVQDVVDTVGRVIDAAPEQSDRQRVMLSKVRKSPEGRQ